MKRARTAAAVAALAAVLGVAGCAEDQPPDPITITDGRACLAVERDTVEATLGVRFDTSVPASVDQTSTCVLAQQGQAYPDLTVTMSQSDADVVIFQVTAVPAGATAVADLGRIAYQVTLPAGTAPDGTSSGPALELGWLSAAPRLMTLRYTWPAGATDADVTTLAPKLLDLAHGIEHALLVGPTLG